MYSRFKALENFSEQDLEELQDSTVAVIGLGATGSVVAEHLARHGVNLVIVDRDYLEEKDIYSSMIYDIEQCQKSIPKAAAAKEKLSDLTEIEAHVENFNAENTEIIKEADLIVDGTDNMETRFLINEYSKKNDIPWIYTAALAEEGYSMLFDDQCFNCIFETVSPGELDTCESAGILREVSTRAASRSAETAVKYLTGKEPSEKLWKVEDGEFKVESPGCEVCGDGNYEYLGTGRQVGSVCGENKYQIDAEINEEAVESLREVGDIVSENEYLVRGSYEGGEIVLFRSGRAIIEAEDKGHAKSVFSEVVGI